MQAISIRDRLSPHTMELSASVPRDALREYVQHQQDRLYAISEQRPLPEAPQGDRRVWELYSNISTGMRAFGGSNEERPGARSNLFSITFQNASLAGEIADDILSEMERGINNTLTYSRAKLGQIAAANPYICARYFDRVVSTFVDVVLNWDMENNCSRREPGLFGCTKASYAATESQNSTESLHTHMLIWIDGMPSTVDEYYRMCSLDGSVLQ
ncbi:Helitron helicase-like domain [Phytophthora cactorum]|nr:Helitron helicase-like domain [Phytophthora cactorum]